MIVMARPAHPTHRVSQAQTPGSLHHRAWWLSIGLLLLACCASCLGFFSVSAPRHGASVGRLVLAGSVTAFQTNQPQAFTQDDFWLLRLTDGSFMALYAYPPGFFGHAQGCRIRWDLHFPYAPPRSPAVWYEGCGGALWDPAGHKLFGPGPGDLDRFPVRVVNGAVVVDTRRLQCASQPCERVTEPVTQIVVTLSDHGFAPAQLHLPVNRPVFVLLKNDTRQAQDWHLVGVQDVADNARRWPVVVPPGEAAVPAWVGSDIHTPMVRPGSQLGAPFTVAQRGTFIFQSDMQPSEFRGNAVMR
jgi:hypothetical protein